MLPLPSLSYTMAIGLDPPQPPYSPCLTFGTSLFGLLGTAKAWGAETVHMD